MKTISRRFGGWARGGGRVISRQKGGGVRSFFCHRLGYLRGIKIEKGNLRWWSVVIEIERIKKKKKKREVEGKKLENARLGRDEVDKILYTYV